MKKFKKKTTNKSRKQLTPKNLDPYSIGRDDLTRLDEERGEEIADDPNEDDE